MGFGVSLTDTAPVSVDMIKVVNKMFPFTTQWILASTFHVN